MLHKSAATVSFLEPERIFSMVLVLWKLEKVEALRCPRRFAGTPN